MTQSERFLEGVPAAVTGGARGIGRAIAERLAHAGARVTVGDIDADEAQAAAGAIGEGAVAMALDVSDADRFAAFLDASGRRTDRSASSSTTPASTGSAPSTRSRSTRP
jgi:NAD(P)-dependent dehydrogenase (short-subunit alcohol dehydrogenase family)